MPFSVAVVVAIVHGDMVRRVPDIGAARRRGVLGAAVNLEGECRRDADIDADAYINADEVADFDAEIKGRASLVGRNSGGGSRNSQDSRLHFADDIHKW